MAERKDLTWYEAAQRKRVRVSAFLIFLAAPATILIGAKFGQNRYMLLSVLILFYTMLPFFMVFERRRPKAREIVLIAMTSALTVCVHILFHITVPVPIGTAMVIISGISLGPEAGFLVGAVSRFIANFYMGQGPWTPWQMFCWGILGFLAGLVFNKVDLGGLKTRNFKAVMGPVLFLALSMLAAYGCYVFRPAGDKSFLGWRLYLFGLSGLIAGVLFQRKKLPVNSLTLTVFTFAVSFIIYGGIMNIGTLVTAAIAPGGRSISLKSLGMLYIAGVPYDFFHAGSAALCVFLFGESIIRKLERIKIKYGIYK